MNPKPRAAREVRYIVVRNQTLARNLLVRLLVNGDSSWCSLASKYSLDHGSRDRCGTSLVTNGMLIRPLDKIVFSGRRSVPVLVTGHGYATILEPLSAIFHGGSRTQVKQMPRIQRQVVLVGRWEDDAGRGYCTGKNVTYRNGFRPDPDPTTSCTSSSTKH